jgi:large subunit ribosomal protein L23
MGNPLAILGILEPVITEQTAQMGIFVTKVDARMNKLEIKDAIEKAFGVTVKKIRTCRYLGKRKGNAFKGKGKRSGYKKAFVTLQNGENIDLLSGV